MQEVPSTEKYECSSVCDCGCAWKEIKRLREALGKAIKIALGTDLTREAISEIEQLQQLIK